MQELKQNQLKNASTEGNNVILWNVPERSETGMTCENFVNHFLEEHIGIKESIEVERAHRTPSYSYAEQSRRPRPIHVKLLRYQDRQVIFRQAKVLKDKPFKGSKYLFQTTFQVQSVERGWS